MNTALSHPCHVCVVPVGEIINLRHRVLLPKANREEAYFDGDDAPDTYHFAGYLNSTQPPICCASFMLSKHDGTPAWQLRGMAGEDGHRGQGFGGTLLKLAELHLMGDVRYDEVRAMWCNAREGAVPFYIKQGWIVVSEIFQIRDVGWHYVMYKKM